MCLFGASYNKKKYKTEDNYSNKVYEEQKAVYVSDGKIYFPLVDVLIIPGDMLSCDLAIHSNNEVVQINITQDMLNEIKKAMGDIYG